MIKKIGNLEKLYRWEYWPSSMFYIPNIPFALFHAMKAKNLVFYTAVNPTIENSGIGTESKFKTMQLIPEKYLAKTVFHQANTCLESTIQKIKSLNICYPLIAKPDVGFRGLLVKKIHSEVELKNYILKYPIDILVQEFLSEKHECGIFYHRFPNEETGKITSITLKKFLHVTGNGKLSLEDLIKNDERAKNYFDFIKDSTIITLDSIVESGQEIQLSEIGNHSKGTQFINGNHLISIALEEKITEINKQIDGWFYGRLDIKYNSFEDLEKGNFKILELNGILAEPTHIYDASKTNYLQALKEMRTHWKHLYKIARLNHDTREIPYRSTFDLLKDVKKLKNYTKNIAKLNRNAS